MLRESGEDGAEVGLGIEAPVPSAVPSQDYRSPAPVASVAELRPTEAMGGTEFGAKVVRQLQIEPRKLGQVGAQAFRALTLDLAPGVQQPIALLDATTDLPPPQAGALADIHNEFIEHIEAAAGVSSDQELNETWDRQQTEADSRYRIVFGEAAFMRMQMDAARNARGVPSGPDFP